MRIDASYFKSEASQECEEAKLRFESQDLAITNYFYQIDELA